MKIFFIQEVNKKIILVIDDGVFLSPDLKGGSYNF